MFRAFAVVMACGLLAVASMGCRGEVEVDKPDMSAPHWQIGQ